MKKLPLDYIKTFGSTAGDDQFAKVVALFNFDGSDGDRTTSGLDASNNNLSLTYDSAGDELSSTQKKFGSTSLYIADNVRVSSTEGFNMGTGDFTMEAWFYFTTLSAGFGIFDQWNSGTSLARSQLWHGSSAGGQLKFYHSIAGQSTQTIAFADPTISTGSWIHLALVRQSSTVKLYVNGTADSTSGSTSGNVHRTDDMWFGDQQTGGGNAPQYYMDDLRITKGAARYTSNFTAPTSAHLSSAGDSFKQLIVNEDADGVVVGTSGINASRIAKAWAEFDGSGVTLNASYNVSSITDHGNRDYTINFSTAMTDANYSIVGSNIGQTASYNWSVVTGMGTAKTTSAARINVPHINDSSLYGNDPDAVNVIAFGN